MASKMEVEPEMSESVVRAPPPLIVTGVIGGADVQSM
jgi:hypothetical protein